LISACRLRRRSQKLPWGNSFIIHCYPASLTPRSSSVAGERNALSLDQLSVCLRLVARSMRSEGALYSDVERQRFAVIQTANWRTPKGLSRERRRLGRVGLRCSLSKQGLPAVPKLRAPHGAPGFFWCSKRSTLFRAGRSRGCSCAVGRRP